MTNNIHAVAKVNAEDNAILLNNGNIPTAPTHTHIGIPANAIVDIGVGLPNMKQTLTNVNAHITYVKMYCKGVPAANGTAMYLTSMYHAATKVHRNIPIRNRSNSSFICSFNFIIDEHIIHYFGSSFN